MKNARDRILGAQRSAPTPFELNGETLYIRKPTVADVQRISERSKKMDDMRGSAFAIIDFVVDAEGAQVFTPADVDGILQIEVDIFKALSNAVTETMGKISERAPKKSEATLSEPSSTP